nr:hypothetical protein Iba_chr02bCG20160 [Ipomoea batatas]
MPPEYILASQVCPLHTRAIRVRLVRTYEVPVEETQARANNVSSMTKSIHQEKDLSKIIEEYGDDESDMRLRGRQGEERRHWRRSTEKQKPRGLRSEGKSRGCEGVTAWPDCQRGWRPEPVGGETQRKVENCDSVEWRSEKWSSISELNKGLG